MAKRVILLFAAKPPVGGFFAFFEQARLASNSHHFVRQTYQRQVGAANRQNPCRPIVCILMIRSPHRGQHAEDGIAPVGVQSAFIHEVVDELRDHPSHPCIGLTALR